MTKRQRGGRRETGPELDAASPSAAPRAGMLAEQVAEALRFALALLDDPRLEDATLRDVVPEGGALRATVVCPPDHVPGVIAALDRAMPRIRYELASEIHRKRLPNVRFVVLPESAT
jgi:ribosome-binding factor A